MGKNSAIEWTDHTFNPWWGCFKVSPGCEHCYAETLDKRFVGDQPSHWGKGTGRRFFAKQHWHQVYKWDDAAKESDTPVKVFCGSMCDVFEDNPILSFEQKKLWHLIENTPNLTWLLLTKRPENVERLIPERWLVDGFPDHVWLGVTVENQHYTHRIAIIQTLNVHRFVSLEPLLSSISLDGFWWAINWAIVGGESGSAARPMHPEWVRYLRGAAAINHTPFLFKQWGEWKPVSYSTAEVKKPLIYVDKQGKIRDTNELGHFNIPEDWQLMQKVGKTAAGCLLDGEEYKAFPDFWGKELDLTANLPKGK